MVYLDSEGSPLTDGYFLVLGDSETVTSVVCPCEKPSPALCCRVDDGSPDSWQGAGDPETGNRDAHRRGCA